MTKTHGDRSGADAYYKRTDFDKLIIFDVGFLNPIIIDVNSIKKNRKYPDRLPGRYKIERHKTRLTNFMDVKDIPELPAVDRLSSEYREFLKVMNTKNKDFPDAIEKFRKKYKLDYKELLEYCCNLTIDEIDSLFSEENFRLVTGVKGFAAEEHFNILLEENNIPYQQSRHMYNKVDHRVGETRKKVQVKMHHERSTTSSHWGVKIHKSHGHSKDELYPSDVFDILALFIGYRMNVEKSKYLPQLVKREFIFIPITDLPRHSRYSNRLARIAKIKKGKYQINDLSIFM